MPCYIRPIFQLFETQLFITLLFDHFLIFVGYSIRKLMWIFPVRNTVHSQGVPKISYVQNFQSCCLLKFSKKVSILHIVGIVLLGTMMDSDQRICFLLSVLVTLWREYLIIKLLQVPFSICSGKYFDQKLTVTHICARLQGQRLSFFLMLSSFPFITMRNWHCTAPAQSWFRGLDLRLRQLNTHKMFYASQGCFMRVEIK